MNNNILTIPRCTDSWDQVKLLRKSAEAYARVGDDFGAALEDSEASKMVKRLQEAEKQKK